MLSRFIILFVRTESHLPTSNQHLLRCCIPGMSACCFIFIIAHWSVRSVVDILEDTYIEYKEIDVDTHDLIQCSAANAAT